MKDLTQSKRLRKRVLRFFLSILGVLLLLLLWEGVVQSGLVSAKVFAPPSKIYDTFLMKLTSKKPDGGTLPQHFATSMKLALMGFGVAAVVGVPLGLCMGYFKAFDYFFNPIFEIVRPIPPIAWIPIILMTLGIGLKAKVFIIFISSFVPTVINSYVGIKRTDPVLINVAKTAGANKWQIFFRVGIPSAVPMVFTGLKVSLGAAWSTLVAAEMLASSSGLGFMIQMGRTLVRSDVIVVGMLVIGATGALMSGVLNLVEKRIAPWRNKSK